MDSQCVRKCSSVYVCVCMCKITKMKNASSKCKGAVCMHSLHSICSHSVVVYLFTLNFVSNSHYFTFEIFFFTVLYMHKSSHA